MLKPHPSLVFPKRHPRATSELILTNVSDVNLKWPSDSIKDAKIKVGNVLKMAQLLEMAVTAHQDPDSFGMRIANELALEYNHIATIFQVCNLLVKAASQSF